jgi:hypothetical protein
VATAKHAEDVVGLIGINNDLLESLGLTWSSENERVLLQQWLYEELEIRVGLRLSSLMLPSQLNEFEEFFDENDDDATASRWLSETFPEHKGFIRYEYELLKSDVIEGRIRPPGPPDPEPESSQILANLAAALGAVREWMRFSAAGQWSKFFDFAEANRSTLVNDFSRGLLSLAQGLDRGWPLHEAHLYILAAAKTIPIIRIAQLASSSNLLRDHLVDLLDKGDFWMLFLAGSWAEYRYPQSAHMVFYAALGAEGANIHRTALLLMEQSGKYASADQVEDGVRTIGERIAVVGWTNEVVVELQNALRAGHSKRSGS